MNMDFAAQLADVKAKQYCEGKPGERAYIYSAYFAGYMQNAAETQALRQIVRRIEMKEENAKVPSTPAEKAVVYVAPTPPPINTHRTFTDESRTD
jgi:hypothetical protein